MAQNFLNQSGWLSFSPSTPRLYITAEDADFDESIIDAWTHEGFVVTYLPMGKGGKAYREVLEGLGRGLGVGEKYAIVAYGDAASFALDAHLQPHAWSSRLCALIAYYPSTIPAPTTKYPSHMRVLVHLPGGYDISTPSTVGVSRVSEILGIQGKRRVVQKRITPGSGAGGLQLHMSYRCYTYSGVDAGFAERDLDTYDGVADSVAWSRSLYTVRRAFGAEVELERLWEEKFEASWKQPDSKKIKEAYTEDPEPYVVHGPTLTGGMGKTEVLQFYENRFMPKDAEAQAELDMEVLLLGRTVGTDSIVDELHISFTHAIEMPWILPNIPPTNKDVDVVIICIVTLRAGKIWSERIYWDQASVLLQVGLLDAKNMPGNLKKKGIKNLPIVGGTGAAKILDLVTKGEGEDMGTGVEEFNQMLQKTDLRSNGQANGRSNGNTNRQRN